MTATAPSLPALTIGGMNFARPQTPPVTFVTCIEAGPLEPSVIWMIQSLRRWGGRFANCPVIAVTPRYGPALRRRTLEELDRLDVRYVRQYLEHAYTWYNFLNKPASLVIAERHARTEMMAWLDADVLVAGEPDELHLAENVDWAACPSDRNLGSTGPGDRYEPYWSQLCRVLDLDVRQLPWVTTCREGTRIRFYFNGGICCYRRDSDYAARYLSTCLAALEARCASRDAGLYFIEQCCFGLTVLRFGLRWKALPEDHNYTVGSRVADSFDADAYARARLIHYHDAMWPDFYPRFCQMLRQGQPAMHAWLSQQGPLSARGPLWSRMMTKALKTVRGRRQRKVEAACTRH
ncbi:MAG: hypothetical protein WD042_17540 [Phycisphaeraceae bacterium]